MSFFGHHNTASFSLGTRSVKRATVKRNIITKMGFNLEHYSWKESLITEGLATIKYDHLHSEVRVGGLTFYFQGFGYDPATGRTIHSDFQGRAVLQMFLMAPDEQTSSLASSEAFISKVSGLKANNKKSDLEIFAQMLDAAVAINKREFVYVSSNKPKFPRVLSTPSPTNSNAGLIACLEYAGLIRPFAGFIRSALQIRHFCGTHLALGYRRNLLKEIKIGKFYQEMAKRDGATVATLAAHYRDHNPWASAAAEGPVPPPESRPMPVPLGVSL